MTQTPSLSVIIVSFNTREMTLRCLQDLYLDLEGIDSEIIVVDNASSDGSPNSIETSYPAIRVIRNEENVGFGAANNQALKAACGRYFLMLNSDAFVHGGCCSELLKFLGTNPEVGVVGPRLVNQDGSLQISCFPFPSPARAWIENLWLAKIFPNHSFFGDYRGWAHDSVREVDWVVGACLLCRREVVEKAGDFDPAFFMYSEETDWQQRVKRAGWQIAFTPHALVTHLGGASGASNSELINRHFFQSFDRYQLKNHGGIGLLLTRAAMVVGSCLRLVAWGAVWISCISRRSMAMKKVQHYTWLLVRQASTQFPSLTK